MEPQGSGTQRGKSRRKKKTRFTATRREEETAFRDGTRATGPGVPESCPRTDSIRNDRPKISSGPDALLAATRVWITVREDSFQEQTGQDNGLLSHCQPVLNGSSPVAPFGVLLWALTRW